MKIRMLARLLDEASTDGTVDGAPAAPTGEPNNPVASPEDGIPDSENQDLLSLFDDEDAAPVEEPPAEPTPVEGKQDEPAPSGEPPAPEAGMSPAADDTPQEPAPQPGAPEEGNQAPQPTGEQFQQQAQQPQYQQPEQQQWQQPQAPEPQWQPQWTPEQIGEMQQRAAEQRNQLEAQLQKELYAVPEDRIPELMANPEKVLPEMMARMHMNMVDTVQMVLQQQGPQIVQQNLAQGLSHAHAKQAFYQQWPGLKAHDREVGQMVNQFVGMNPQASAEEVRNNVGLMASIRFRVPLPGMPGNAEQPQEQGQAPQPDPNTPPPAPPTGVAPQTPSAAQKPQGSGNMWADMAEELLNDEDF